MAKRKNNTLSRKTKNRPYRAVCWVSAEGKTEKDYFKMDAFVRPEIVVKFPKETRSNRHNPISVLERLQVNMKKETFRKGDEAWVVVDVDRWEKSEFSKLLKWVEADSRHHLAISNPKFELFLLMHFDKGNGCTTAQAIDSALKRCMPQYEKRINADQFGAEDVKVAINNASMKRRSCNNIIPDPGMTDAYLLAEQLIGGE